MSIAVTTTPSIAELSDQLLLRAQRVGKLEEPGTPLSPEDLQALLQTHQRVKLFSEEIFGSGATIEPSSDPETDAECFVVNVPARGQVDKILQLDSEWHRRLDEPAGKAAFLYRLSLDVS